MTHPASTFLNKKIRPYSCAALESALQDFKTGDTAEALHHTLEAAEDMAADLVLDCEIGGAAEEYADDVLTYVKEAIRHLVDAKRYYDQEQDERATRV